MSNDNYDGHQRQLSCRTFAGRFGRRGAGGTSSDNASQRFCLRSTKRPVSMSPQICTPPLMRRPVQMMISVRAGRSLRTSSSDVIMRFGLRRPSAGISSPGQRNLGAAAHLRGPITIGPHRRKKRCNKTAPNVPLALHPPRASAKPPENRQTPNSQTIHKMRSTPTRPKPLLAPPLAILQKPRNYPARRDTKCVTLIVALQRPAGEPFAAIRQRATGRRCRPNPAQAVIGKGLLRSKMCASILDGHRRRIPLWRT